MGFCGMAFLLGERFFGRSFSDASHH